jgi:pyruvate dehydrogenase E2 component (dihydrolipoamide acetyltransferase)
MSERAIGEVGAEVAMPRLSDSMEQGTILRWLIGDGQTVARGQELVEIETDKASMTHEADRDGVLEVVAREGETVPVGGLIARIGASSAVTGGQHAPSPSPLARVATPSTGPALARGRGATTLPPPAAPPATPLARRAGRLHDVALERLAGSGPRGRIVQADVLRAAGIADARPAPAAATSSAASAVAAPRAGETAKGATRRVEPTNAQRLVARRMSEAKATIPHFQVQTDVAMDAALTLRGELKVLLEAEAPSLNDLIVKACALALRGHERANGSYVDGGYELHERVNVGVAVAGEGMLVVPVVHDADAKPLAQIARETRLLAERVRLGAIAPPELAGGTFTVSNLGMYGMTQIVPVVNPPQAAILGVGALRAVLAREAGEIVERRLLTLTLSCDHRILHGADAALFLAEVKELLEGPLRLVL